MPPKKTVKRKRAAAPKKSNKRYRGSDEDTHTRYDDDDDDDEQDDEINTIQDYEEAVRRRHLSSAVDRYEDARDDLVYAAELMMPNTSNIHPLGQDGDVYPNHGPEKEQSTRPTTRSAVVFNLGTYCLYSIAKHFKKLAYEAAPSSSTSSESATTASTRPRFQSFGGQRIQTTPATQFRIQVNHLPDYLSSRLFKYLKHTKPELLSTRIWTRLFFPQSKALTLYGGASNGVNDDDEEVGSSLTDLDLEGLIESQVTDNIINGYLLRTIHIGPNLERINLNQQTGLSDRIMAQLVGACPVLRRLSLKGCTNAGDLTLVNLPGDTLEELNISFVKAPTAKGIKLLILKCRQLRVLKMASLVNIRDAIFLELEKDLAEEDEERKTKSGANSDDQRRPLHQLENLKISTTKLGDRGLKVLLGLCGTSLRRLDISGTDVKKIAIIAQYCVQDNRDLPSGGRSTPSRPTTNLEKINLTRLKVASPADLISFFERLPPHSLHTVLMGYLTCGQVPIRDDLVNRLVPFLEPDGEESFEEDKAEEIDHIHPVGGSSSSSLVEFPSPFAPLLSRPPSSLLSVFHIHTLSFFGNSQIGVSKHVDYGLHLLFQRLAPFLKRLELGYTRCHAQLLDALLPQPQLEEDNGSVIAVDLGTENWVLEELGLDETPIDDDAADTLSRMPSLRRLSLVNTRIGMDGAKKVIESCPNLASLELTSCRGIPLMHRRTLLREVRREQAALASEVAS
ncbi:hypothetical protein EMPS_05933 [Entomortierella parvispora]|uniref:RNI-like protein n=1 Tax=Entomortierella parvispora TaxID=205924 RepID=A0A9P3HBB1_9FUNG|nr:hypothetical protein EMPS_05933 [Entomortierella parvispora]